MGLNYDRKSLQSRRGLASNSNAETEKDERPSAQFWLNIGYYAVDPVTGEDKFISLRKGVALDDQEMFKLNIKDENFRNLRAAQNALLTEIKELTAKMKPGQEIDLGEKLELTIQLRMRQEEVVEQEPAEQEANPYIRTRRSA